jgi:type I restriction enzyme, S subunit
MQRPTSEWASGGKSTISHLTAEALRRHRFPFPSRREQTEIVTFLDRETGKIDALVAEQERLIALLKEKRQAVISQAVTKGLDPNVPTKPSGVEWLGEVPGGWDIDLLKRNLSAPLMYGANESAEEDTPSNPRFVRITDIDADGGLRDETFRSLPRDIAEPYLLCDRDILLARSGATVGKSFIYRPSWGVCCFAGYLIRARFKRHRLIPEFVNYFCASSLYWAHIKSDQIQSTIPNFSAEKYGMIRLPRPPLSEQERIVAFLDDETDRIDRLITEAGHSVALLQERRAAVISAAVTGKIDVRNLVQPPAEQAAAA